MSGVPNYLIVFGMVKKQLGFNFFMVNNFVYEIDTS